MPTSSASMESSLPANNDLSTTALNKESLLVVLPFNNLSDKPVPSESLRDSFALQLVSRGLNLLPDSKLESFMERHRWRNLTGLNDEMARLLQEETGVLGVIIGDVTHYDQYNPPALGLMCRLVTTRVDGGVVWSQGLSLTGADSPGLLELGLIHDVEQIDQEVIGQMSERLTVYLADGRRIINERKKFKPVSYFRSPEFSHNKVYTIAVLPFTNHSLRRDAGELLVRYFLSYLSGYDDFRVLDPGLIRQRYLDLRMITPDGVSLDNVRVLSDRMDADLYLTGSVINYSDYGTPGVSFSAQIIQRKDQKILWSSYSTNNGGERVYAFGLGKVTTGQELASLMVKGVVELIAEY